MSATRPRSAPAKAVATLAAYAAHQAAKQAMLAANGAEEAKTAMFDDIDPFYLPYCLGCESGSESGHRVENPVTGEYGYHKTCYFAN